MCICRTSRVGVLSIVAIWVGLSSVASARPRTWTAQDGEKLKADFSGVLEGKVVLKQSSRIRKYVPLENLSIEDRDYVARLLINTEREDRLKELLTRANEQLEAGENSEAPEVGTSDVSPPKRTRSRSRSTAKPKPSQFGIGAATVEAGGAPKTMYGLPIPSSKWKPKAVARVWTDVLGQTTTATFAGLVAPGHLLLKVGDSPSATRFTLTYFVKEDIAYIDSVLKGEALPAIFPVGRDQPVTQAEQDEGYRLWTDQSGVQLKAKFIRQTETEVMLYVGKGGEQGYSLAGLSDADQTWITTELARRSEAAQAAAEELRLEVQKADEEKAAAARDAQEKTRREEAARKQAAEKDALESADEGSFEPGEWVGRAVVFVVGIVGLVLVFRKVAG